MRKPMKRHLVSLLGPKAEPGSSFEASAPRAVPARAPRKRRVVPLEMNPHDYVSYLLAMDAEIEHSLMVQYLYAAWSLGGPQVPEAERPRVARWQSTVLGIAKEEMGHLMGVQNVLRLIGAPLHLGREDYPADNPFYPFPFMLEPAGLDTLAKYVYAESPPLSQWRGELQDEVLARVNAHVDEPRRVGALFDRIIGLMKDPKFLPDATFEPETYPFQASFGEWGRSHGGGEVPPPGKGRRADVLVGRVATRDDAVAALLQIAEQGEATSGATRQDDESPSHFTRFVEVYEGVRGALKDGWSPFRRVAVNPYVPTAGDDQGDVAGIPRSAITNREARLWAHLFNVRYRLLLQLLIHSFRISRAFIGASTKTPRGAIIHATFGEMYNLRAIAHVLMQTPLGSDAGVAAGPPFIVPYTLDLPPDDDDCWRCHRDLLDASARLGRRLAKLTSADRQGYLRALGEADQGLLRIIDRVLGEDRGAR
jgi:hypothetical protein